MRVLIFLLTILILVLLLSVLVNQRILSDIINPLIRHSNLMRFSLLLALMVFVLGLVKLLLSYGKK